MSDATGFGPARGHIVAFDELAPTQHSHELVGAEHGDVPFSVILVHSRPGVGSANGKVTRAAQTGLLFTN